MLVSQLAETNTVPRLSTCRLFTKPSWPIMSQWPFDVDRPKRITTPINNLWPKKNLVALFKFEKILFIMK